VAVDDSLKAALINCYRTRLYHCCQVTQYAVASDLLNLINRKRMWMDACFLIQQRLKELGLEQRDLAVAAEVTESYVSQLLTRKKLPTASNRTNIYEKISLLLKLPKGKLAALVETQRREELRKNWPSCPCRLVRKCAN
jgi:hypothetical protein